MRPSKAATPCPDENALLAFFSRDSRATGGESIEEHIDACDDCRHLLADLVRLRLDGRATADTEGPGHRASAEVREHTPPASTERASFAAPPDADDLPRGTTIGRYLLIERLGAGGMGVVYLAYDPEIDRRIAIKLIRTDRGDPRQAEERQQRLLREARAMARPQHPEVIAVHDAGTALGQVFIAMEYVDGSTLRQWLAAAPRSWREVLSLFVRVGRGLSAAHSAGLVHRDFKPDNVLVGKDGRVRVTDFGLARLVASEPAAVPSSGDATTLDSSPPLDKLTRSGQFLGSPAYAAPEQMEGATADARADVFSFCCALYEGLYGERPFAGRTLYELRAAIDQRRIAPAPKGARVPAWLRQTVLRGLARDPGDRWPSMEALLSALGKDRQRLIRTALLGLALLVVVSAAFLTGSRSARIVPVERPAEKLVAVLELKNQAANAEAGWLSTAISEVVSAELHAGGGPRIAPADEVARMQRELKLAAEAAPPPDAIRRVGDNLRADYVVTGGYSARAGGGLSLQLRLTDVATGRALAVADESGRDDALLALASRAGSMLRAGLGLQTLAAREGLATQASLPSSPDAARAYARALWHLRLGDAVQARGFAEEAARIEPGHAWSLLLLARAWKALGYDQKARDAATRAEGASGRLGREDQLTLEASSSALRSEWDRAIELYRVLVGFFPDRIDYALRLADVQVSAHRGKECVATFAALRKRPAADPDDPNLDLAESGCATAASDFRRALALAERAVDHASRRGAPLLAASARTARARALTRLGQLDLALEETAAAEKTFHELSDRGSEAKVLVSRGIIFNERFEFNRARPILESALALYTELGNRAGMMSTLNQIANGSPPARARQLYDRMIAIAREVDDRAAVAMATMNGALADANEGDVSTACRRLREASSLAHEVGDRYGEGTALLLLSFNLLRCGDLAGARAAADAVGKLWAETGETTRLAMLELSRASLFAEEKRYPEAAAQARAAAERSRQNGSESFLVFSLTVLADALAASGRIAEATRVVAQARALLPKADDKLAPAAVSYASGRVKLASGRASEWESAVRELSTSAELAKANFSTLESRDARLALGEALLKAHKPGAREQLGALEREARTGGDVFIAQKAAALLGK